jgi:hypothetical protein
MPSVQLPLSLKISSQLKTMSPFLSWYFSLQEISVPICPLQWGLREEDTGMHRILQSTRYGIKASLLFKAVF